MFIINLIFISYYYTKSCKYFVFYILFFLVTFGCCDFFQQKVSELLHTKQVVSKSWCEDHGKIIFKIMLDLKYNNEPLMEKVISVFGILLLNMFWCNKNFSEHYKAKKH